MFWINEFISLVYPKICAACGNSLWSHEKVICTSCEFRLPKTNYHLLQENPVSGLFWGRGNIYSASAYLFFHKGSRVQQLVHQLKYKGRKDVGISLGKIYGLTLLQSPWFNDLDLIIPVPLHPKKLTTRGYNQSEQFGLGLSESMKIPLNTQSLIRNEATETQTKMNRFKRWENVNRIFKIKDPALLTGKNILLIDDVITTGATLEACIQALSEIPETRISIVAIAAALR
jgi:ComF family protein